jgi:hypothetical protein
LRSARAGGGFTFGRRNTLEAMQRGERLGVIDLV